MGLLDSIEGLMGSSMDDPKTMAMLQLASGLLGNRNLARGLNQGLLGYGQTMQAAAERQRAMATEALKGRLLEAQIGDTQAQEQQRREAALKAQRIEAATQALLAGGGAPNQYGAEGQGIRLGGQTEPMRPTQGGLAGAPLEQIAALKAAGGPDLLEAWKTGQTGVKMDPGAGYVMNGRMNYMPTLDKGQVLGANGQVSLAPGFLQASRDATSATKDAELAAAAKYELVPGYANGRPVSELKSNVIAFLQPQQPEPRADWLAPAGQPGTQFSSPAVRDAVMRAASNARAPAGWQTGPSEGEKRTTDAITSGNAAFMKESYTPALQAGESAQRSLTSVQSARNALSNLRTGWGTDTVASAANVLAALGVPQAEKVATSAQTFQQAAMDRLWTTLNAAKGPQTEGDAERAAKTWARLQNTPRANAYILDLAEASARMDKMRADYFRQALPHAQRAGDLQDIERRWAAYAPSVFSMPMMQKWGINE